MTRKTIFEGAGLRLSVDEGADGSVCLLRSTDFDSGPAQSVTIPKDALLEVGAALITRHTKARAVGTTGTVIWDGTNMIVDGWVIDNHGETYVGLESVVDAVIATILRERVAGVGPDPTTEKLN